MHCRTGLSNHRADLLQTRVSLLPLPGLEKLIVLGPGFGAAPLAAFAAEHLAGPSILEQAVPPWMPAPLFWTYYFGIALQAAALSLVLKKYVRWSAPLLALMFFIFVLSIHVSGVIAHPKERLVWTVMLRDLTFAAGALALTATTRQQGNAQLSTTLTSIARIAIAVPLIFFGIQHLLHPSFAPRSVPLPKSTPAWVPLRFPLGVSRRSHPAHRRSSHPLQQAIANRRSLRRPGGRLCSRFFYTSPYSSWPPEHHRSLKD